MKKLTIIAGPCVVEDRVTTMLIAEKLDTLCQALNIDLIFKASYRKANRSRMDSFSSIGDLEALNILADIQDEFGMPVITDIHEAAEAARAAEFVDMLQIPAFLCRQTDLLVAAAKTGVPVNIKKGQFMSAIAMRDAIDKINAAGHRRIIITERGNSFGYNNVVVDMRNIMIMQNFCDEVFVDVTHTNGGRFVQSLPLGTAAIAAGADGVFFETHPDPSKALSDGKNMIPLDQVEFLLTRLIRIKEAMG